jgi:hypothetical protein
LVEEGTSCALLIHKSLRLRYTPRLVAIAQPKGFTLLLNSQRLRSKLRFSLTRRPTLYCIQLFLGKISLEALLPSCVNLQSYTYVHRRKRLSSSSLGLQSLPGILYHSYAVQLRPSIGGCLFISISIASLFMGRSLALPIVRVSPSPSSQRSSPARVDSPHRPSRVRSGDAPLFLGGPLASP